MLNKQIFLYSVGTDAFYNTKEKNIHKKLLRCYILRNKINNFEHKSEWKQRKTWINKVIKTYKEELVDILNKNLTNDLPRELDVESLTQKTIVSSFDSTLVRTLGLEYNQITDKLMIVNVFFFQVFEDLVKKGFLWNGEKYVFLTASAGQIRTKKSVFIKEKEWLKYKNKLLCGLSYEEINKKGGINQNKFLAYLALVNSATDVWEDFDIRRAIVVDDFNTCFKSEVDYIDYQTYEIERKVMDVEIPCTDGWGIVDGETTRMCRLPWIKGLVSNFPLQRYLREKCTPDQWVVTDIWGTKHNVVEENIKYIFTKSQMKLHNFYKDWNEYCDNYEKYDCEAGFCNIEEDKLPNTRINYQMLQQLVDVSDKEIETLIKKSVYDIENIGQDYQTTMRLLGATEYNKNPSWFQQALMIYPELFKDPYCRDILKQTKKSLVKQAKGGRIRVNGKYLFVAPNPLVFCENLFKGITQPEEQLAENEVYTNQFPNGVELALLRSPSLGKEWAIKTNKRNEELDKWLGNTKCVYTSSYDTISKLLSFDCDGDSLLVLQDKNLTNLGKRLMKNVVPLYYEMKKAKPNILSAQSIYDGMSVAFTCGNIGPISNLITIVKNNNEEDREEADKVIKWLTMEVNFRIDGSKTLFFLERPKYVDEIIKKHTKGKLPHFFMYAKDKESNQVETINNSTMNRICKAIPDSKLKFSKSISKFDYRMLMNMEVGFDISENNSIIKSYDYWNSRLNEFNEDKNVKNQDMYKYRFLRDSVEKEVGKDIDYIVNTLVVYLYTIRKTSAKKGLWDSFGDIILKNLKRNLQDKGKVCVVCGKRFIPKNNLQICCDKNCFNIKRKEYLAQKKRQERENYC